MKTTDVVLCGHNLQQELVAECKLRGDDVYRLKRVQLPLRYLVNFMHYQPHAPRYVEVPVLSLPADYRVMRVAVDGLCLSVVVWSASFPIVEDGQDAPLFTQSELVQTKVYALATEDEVSARRQPENIRDIDDPQPIIAGPVHTRSAR